MSAQRPELSFKKWEGSISERLKAGVRPSAADTWLGYASVIHAEEWIKMADSAEHHIVECYAELMRMEAEVQGLKSERDGLRKALEASDKLAEAIERCFFGASGHEEPEDMKDLRNKLQSYKALTPQVSEMGTKKEREG